MVGRHQKIQGAGVSLCHRDAGLHLYKARSITFRFLFRLHHDLAVLAHALYHQHLPFYRIFRDRHRLHIRSVQHHHAAFPVDGQHRTFFRRNAFRTFGRFFCPVGVALGLSGCIRCRRLAGLRLRCRVGRIAGRLDHLAHKLLILALRYFCSVPAGVHRIIDIITAGQGIGRVARPVGGRQHPLTFQRIGKGPAHAHAVLAVQQHRGHQLTVLMLYIQ